MEDEVESVTPYNIRPLVLHGYVFPFIFIYLGWFYLLTIVYGVGEYLEAGLIVLAGIGCVQILVCLFCHWSIHVRCSLTCRKVIYRVTAIRVSGSPGTAPRRAALWLWRSADGDLVGARRVDVP